jgi:hypothetical protein
MLNFYIENRDNYNNLIPKHLTGISFPVINNDETGYISNIESYKITKELNKRGS